MKYLLYAVLFSFAWFIFILPKVLPFASSQSPYLQFLIFNIGIFIFLQIFLKAKSSNNKIDWLAGLGVICLFMSMDILMPPLAVDSAGNLLTGMTLSESSSDYVLGYFAINSLNLHGILVFIFVYIVMPFLLLLIASKLLTNFVKNL